MYSINSTATKKKSEIHLSYQTKENDSLQNTLLHLMKM
jgi:hypothetical protein